MGRAFVDPLLVKKATKIKWARPRRLDKVALIMIGLALCIQLLFISQSIVSGDDWYQAIKASDNDAAMLETFRKDVLMSVWAAFWTSVSISWYRQKWAIDKLKRLFQYAWMASACCCCGCRCSSPRRCCDEIDAAFSDGKGTQDTPRLIIYIFIYAVSAIWTALLLIRLKAVYEPAQPDTTARTSGRSPSDKAAKKAHEGCECGGQGRPRPTRNAGRV